MNKDSKNILVLASSGHGQGLGNIVESLPFYKILEKKYPDYKYNICCKEGSELIRYFFENRKNYTISEKPAFTDYFGKYVMYNAHNSNDIKLLHDKEFTPIERMTTSEVYSNICLIDQNCTDISIFDVRDFFKINFLDKKEKLIILANGYNKSSNIQDFWKVKLYPKMPEVCQILKNKGFRVISVGDCHVEGSEDQTISSIENTIDLLNRAHYVICNDSFVSHLAAAMQVQGTVLYTATSIKKNYDLVFHKSLKVVKREDLKCRPCQLIGNGFWLNCIHQECRNIPIDTIIESITTF